MKDLNEVRIKLHVLNSNDTSVKNIWMSLNYSQKPTIAHIVEHLKTNYREQTATKSGLTDAASKSIKLYLDDYWLPPYENSRLIRENDCIKVEINETVEGEKAASKEVESTKSSKKNPATIEPVKSVTENATNAHDANLLSYKNFYYPYETTTTSDSYPVRDYYNYNYNYANDLRNPFVNFASSTTGSNALNDWNSLYSNQKQAGKNLTKSKLSGGEESSKKCKDKETAAKQQKKSPSPTVEKKASASTSNSKQATTSPNTKKIMQTYKKFAIGNFVHMLNNEQPPKNTSSSSSSSSDSDDVSEEQIIDDYYQSIQKSKNGQAEKKKQNNDAQSKTTAAAATGTGTGAQSKQKPAETSNANLDKIANSINTTGKNKWKNSTKPITQTNGPKHIRFPTSDSSSSSSSSDSSDDEGDNNKKTKNAQQQKEQKNTAQYYQPTKEEQLNANPKDVSEFKKTFNQTKLNAPDAEEFIDSESTTRRVKEKSPLKNGNNDSSNAAKVNNGDEGSKSSIKITKNSPSKKSISPAPPTSPRSPRSPKIDFTQYESLKGAPKLNDRIAFQILEISSNFTPEISDYKHGTVVEFDAETNEVTLKLSSIYNAVLKKPSKFSVVLDETEDELNAINKGELVENEKNDLYEDTIKVDWRNLINVRLIPEGQLLSPKSSF